MVAWWFCSGRLHDRLKPKWCMLKLTARCCHSMLGISLGSDVVIVEVPHDGLVHGSTLQSDLGAG